MYEDTIAAISTAVGDAGVGIVRISGPEALAILKHVFRRGERTRVEQDGSQEISLESHRVYYGHAADPESGEVIDEVLAIPMLAPRSYTREDVVEIQCHGGPVPLRRLLLAVLASGARAANPGEFTLRAFLNGRIDLAQAEAVADVIRSRTDRGLAVAMKGLSGDLSGRVRDLRRALLDVMAYLEATIDFSEDDIPEEEVEEPLGRCLEMVQRMLASADQGIVFRQGVRVALVGRPNVGKSSLLNSLLRSDRAIVTEIAGTTRDTLEETANIQGVPFCLVDTAGLTEADNPVERLGVERSRKAIDEADLCLLVVDLSQPLAAEDREAAAAVEDRPVLIVANKSDIAWGCDEEAAGALIPTAPLVSVSTLTGEGMDALQMALVSAVFSGRLRQSDELLVSNPRHKAVLVRVEAHLSDALSSLKARLPADCTASDLRLATAALGEITGETATEGLLETIFARFCIGK